MNTVQIIQQLLSKTESKDKVLRLIQYLTLASTAKGKPSITVNIYTQMRNTRKVMRFLRTLEFSAQIKKELGEIMANKLKMKPQEILIQVLSVLRNIFGLLFFLFDHRVLLSEIGVMSKESHAVNYPRSMRFYILNCFFGVLHNLLSIARILNDGSEAERKTVDLLCFDLIRQALDIFVGIHYLNGAVSAEKAGAVGILTSVMGILQSLKMI